MSSNGPDLFKMKVAVIPCTKEKLVTQKPVMLTELYAPSTLFRLSHRYVCEVLKVDAVWVLSAKHGAQPAYYRSMPYDESLVGMSSVQRSVWADMAADQLEALRGFDTDFAVYDLSGFEYREALDLWFTRAAYMAGITIYRPLEGMRIGKRLGWLKQQVDQAHSLF